MQKNSKKRTDAEKVSFIISLFIISVIFFLVCLAWITGDNNPPILSVTTGKNIRQIEQQYYVPFSVINSGGETVETVEIMAELSFDGEEYETGTQEVDFLSRQEEQSGEFIFSRDPQQGELTIRVASYKLP
jgi:uncharacterized protein (TIGR02588 family)